MMDFVIATGGLIVGVVIFGLLVAVLRLLYSRYIE